jgi:hypothetical protein
MPPVPAAFGCPVRARRVEHRVRVQEALATARVTHEDAERMRRARRIPSRSALRAPWRDTATTC